MAAQQRRPTILYSTNDQPEHLMTNLTETPIATALAVCAIYVKLTSVSRRANDDLDE